MINKFHTFIISSLISLNGHCQSVGKSLLEVIQKLTPRTRSRRIILSISPIFVVIAVAVYGYCIPSSQVFGKVYFKGNASQKVVALTFDDGPNDPYTSQILDILEHYNVQATFFVVGKNVELYPETVKRMLSDGDIIGNHTYTHNANHALTDYGINDMRKGEEAIYNIAGVKPHLYRPPHGKLSPWEIHYVQKAGLIEVTWTIETPELAGQSGTQEAQAIVNKIHPGDIILLHDGYGTEHNDKHADKSATVEAVPLIIQQLEAQGYTFVTFPELLDVTPYLQ